MRTLQVKKSALLFLIIFNAPDALAHSLSIEKRLSFMENELKRNHEALVKAPKEITRLEYKLSQNKYSAAALPVSSTVKKSQPVLPERKGDYYQPQEQPGDHNSDSQIQQISDKVREALLNKSNFC